MPYKANYKIEFVLYLQPYNKFNTLNITNMIFCHGDPSHLWVSGKDKKVTKYFLDMKNEDFKKISEFHSGSSSIVNIAVCSLDFTQKKTTPDPDPAKVSLSSSMINLKPSNAPLPPKKNWQDPAHHAGPSFPSHPPPKTPNFLFIGKENTGKSSLINSLLPCPQIPIAKGHGPLQFRPQAYETPTNTYIDTPGLANRGSHKLVPFMHKVLTYISVETIQGLCICQDFANLRGNFWVDFVVGVIGRFLRVIGRAGEREAIFGNCVFVGTKPDLVNGDRGEL